MHLLNFRLYFSDPDADGIYTGMLSVLIVNDTIREDSGEIIVTLNPTTNYELGVQVSGVIYVVDDDYNQEVPRVSIGLTPGSDSADGEIDEGQSIDIRVSANPAPTEGSPIQVSINVVQVGNYIAFRVPRSITMTSNTATIIIRTIDDSIKQDDGSVTISVLEDEDSYSVNPLGFSISVTVIDNEPTGVDRTDPEDRISVADLAVAEILEILDRPAPSAESSFAPVVILPKISVSAVVSVVDEGSPVQFSISRIGNSQHDIVVAFALVPEGDFFDGLGYEVRQIELIATQQSAMVEFATVDDNIAEQNGTFTLTLLDGDTYDLTVQSSARVVISDLVDRQQRVEDISLASQDILPEMTGAIAARTLGVATDRIGDALSNSGAPSTFMYNGKQTLTELLTAGGEAINADSMTLRNVLGSSSFAIGLFQKLKDRIPQRFGELEIIVI